MAPHSGDPAHHHPDLPPWLEVPADWPTVDQTTLDSAVATCLDALSLTGPEPAHERLVRYYDPASGHAGSTFLTLPPREPDEITASDLLAVSLLDVRLRPIEVRSLLEPGPARDRVTEALRALPDATLWTADTAALLPMSDFYQAVRAAVGRQTDGSDDRWAVASRLCARKRPDLFPIRDALVRERLGISGDRDYRADWQVLRHVTRTPEVVQAIVTARDAAAEQAVPRQIPLDTSRLRLLDVALYTDVTAGRTSPSE